MGAENVPEKSTPLGIPLVPLPLMVTIPPAANVPPLTVGGHAAVRALDPHAERAGSFAAWTAGPWQAHLRRHVIPRPPLPVSCLKMLIRHPSVSKRDGRMIRARKRAGITAHENVSNIPL